MSGQLLAADADPEPDQPSSESEPTRAKTLGDASDPPPPRRPRRNQRATRASSQIGPPALERSSGRAQRERKIPLSESQQQGARLKELREKHGFKTASDAAAWLGVNKYTYIDHESGKRRMTVDGARYYAARYSVPHGYLLSGEDARTPLQVPVRWAIRDKSGRLHERHKRELVDEPVSRYGSLLALAIRTDQLQPRYDRGDILFVPLRTEHGLGELLGQEVVATLKSGERYLTTLRTGGHGFVLRGQDISVVSPAAVSPVVFVQRASPTP